MFYKLLILLLLGSHLAFGQQFAKPSPLAYFPHYAYVRVPAEGFPATWVQTERNRGGNIECVEILNVIIDKEVVRQYTTTRGGEDTELSSSHYPDELLITLVILPDKKTKRVEWVRIQPDTIRAAPQLPFPALAQDAYSRVYAFKAQVLYYNDLTRRLDIKPIVARDGAYWTTPNLVLTEYFLLRNRLTWFFDDSDNVTINCQARLFSPVELQQEQARATASISKRKPAASLEGQSALAKLRARELEKRKAPNLEAELNSKLLLEKVEQGVYSFWSLPPYIMHGGIQLYGVGRFQFQPTVGLLTGQYDNYFDFDIVEIERRTIKPAFQVVGRRTLTSK